MKTPILSLALVCLTWFGIAAAQSFAGAYEQYNEALAAGDDKATLRHARTAFEIAETDSADLETLAVLGQNWLLAALWLEPGQVLEIGPKALNLAEQGFGASGYNQEEIAAALAFAIAKDTPREPECEALVKALSDLRAAGDMTPYSIKLHAESISLMLRHNRGDEAYEAATGMAHVVEKAPSADPDLLSYSTMFRIAALVQMDRTHVIGRPKLSFHNRLNDAHVLADHMMSLFPAQTDLDSFSTTAGEARAWHAFVLALGSTYGVELSKDHVFEGRKPLPIRKESAPGKAVGPFFASQATTGHCEVEWKRQNLTYPRAAQRQGILGGMLIGYDLTKDGRVSRAEVLGEVPHNRFAPQILKQVTRWRADPDSLGPEECRTNRTHWIHFTFHTPTAFSMRSPTP
ncbi:MAG: energy transducer TonB [Parvularculaceae bacterium]|nr:energy transducer TonB [Parvularculaceae bacterium]